MKALRTFYVSLSGNEAQKVALNKNLQLFDGAF
jgi:hypothetical protein